MPDKPPPNPGSDEFDHDSPKYIGSPQPDHPNPPHPDPRHDIDRDILQRVKNIEGIQAQILNSLNQNHGTQNARKNPRRRRNRRNRRSRVNVNVNTNGRKNRGNSSGRRQKQRQEINDPSDG